jgi:hypothetical protein
MGAGSWVLAKLKLAYQGAHLIKGESLPRADRAVAGEGNSHFLAPAFGTAAVYDSVEDFHQIAAYVALRFGVDGGDRAYEDSAFAERLKFEAKF